MRNLLTRLDKIGRFAENTALVALLCGMMLLAVGQIVLREIFATGFIWADELIKLMVLWLAMIGSVAACRDDRHIRIDALSHFLPDRVVDVTRIVVNIFAAVVCGVIAWHAYRYLQIEIEFDDKVMIRVPAWLAHVVVPVSFLLLSYRFVVLVAWQLYEMATGLEREEQEG